MNNKIDVFISHAREDKEEVVRPLVDALKQRGVGVWFDESVLTIGDKFAIKIEEGLRLCRYGLVILSPNFFAKSWPQRELEGLLAREMAEEKQIILPIWHKIGEKEVARHSLFIAQRLALETSVNSIESIADKIANIIKNPQNNEALVANTSTNGIEWHKVANIFWLCHDLMETFRWLLSAVPKDWIDVGLRQSYHHACELNFDQSILSELQQLTTEAAAFQQDDWTLERRVLFAGRVKVIFNTVAQLNQKYQNENGGFNSGPG